MPNTLRAKDYGIVYGTGTAEADKNWWIQPLHTIRYYTKLSPHLPKQMCRVDRKKLNNKNRSGCGSDQ